ncbi:MAG: tRNA (adenosine(37)-N6)-dimethylallyltransferase MiaA, partial [Bacteroidales bacterium]
MNLSQPEHSKKNLVIISGPTAVGKTSVAVKIAQHFHTEIISADSRQLYREIKIGTAVPSDDELAAVKHHMIGTLSIHDSYNAYRFETDVIKLLNNLFLHKKTVIMAGGSGLYIDAVCNGIDVIPDPDPELRIQLNRAFDEKGITPLRNQLKLLDPEYYASADIANHKRIIRALEVCISTGKPYSACLKKNKAPRDFHVIK